LQPPKKWKSPDTNIENSYIEVIRLKDKTRPKDIYALYEDINDKGELYCKKQK
jgi:hypothetical protein